MTPPLGVRELELHSCPVVSRGDGGSRASTHSLTRASHTDNRHLDGDLAADRTRVKRRAEDAEVVEKVVVVKAPLDPPLIALIPQEEERAGQVAQQLEEYQRVHGPAVVASEETHAEAAEKRPAACVSKAGLDWVGERLQKDGSSHLLTWVVDGGRNKEEALANERCPNAAAACQGQ